MSDTSGTDVERDRSGTEGVLESALSVVTEPVPTLRRLTQQPRVAWAVVITVVLALASALAGAAQVESAPAEFGPDLMSGGLRDALLPLSLVLGPIFALLALAIVAGIVQGSSYILGGRGSYAGMFVGLAFANIPSILEIPAQLLPFALGSVGSAIAGIVGFATTVWVVVLGVIAIREHHRFSTGRAVAAAVIPFVLIVGLVALLLLAVAVQVMGGT